MRVLVCHASIHGSTAEIAERLATKLREREVADRVDVFAVVRAPSAIEYDAVVLGSAIHDRAWLPEARAYLLDNLRALASRPVWLFGVGMIDALPTALRVRARRNAGRVFAKLPGSLHPRGTRLFSGVIRKEHLPATGRALVALLGCRYGDLRDWHAIDGWAAEIADGLAARARATTNSAPSEEGERIERRSREESVGDIERVDDPTVSMSTHEIARDRRLEEPSEGAASELVDGAT